MENFNGVIYVSKKLRKTFENVDAPSGYVAGWHEGNDVFCVACGAGTEFFLIGLDVIGLFYCLHEESPSENDLQRICKTLHDSLKVETQRTLVLFVHKLSEKEVPVVLTAKLYSSYYNTLQNADISEKNDVPAMLFRMCGQMPLIFEVSLDADTLKENIESAVEKLKTVISSDVPTFRIKNSNVILQSNSIGDISALCKHCQETDSVEGNQWKSKRNMKNKDPLNFDFLMQVSGEAALGNTVNHTLVIHCQRRVFQCVSLNMPIDVLVVGQLSSCTIDIYKRFIKAIVLQLDKMSQCLLMFAKDNEFICPKPYHFHPDFCDFPVTIIYPLEKTDEHLKNYRTNLQRLLLLPLDRPLLRKQNQCLVSNTPSSGYLINPHIGLSPSGVQGGQLSLVQGRYSYHHYMQDHINDDGWGCAYRSLQTIISWFTLQGYTDISIPTHAEIQKVLVAIGDKPSSFFGSRQWIGSQEVSFCLDHLIQIKSKILFVSSGSEMANKGRDLFNHFRDHGTPIMIGGGVLAHTIIGVDFNQNTGDLKFLILDPHYKGSEDIHIIQNKGWCGWKNVQFWDQSAFYNLCLPQRPVDI